MNQLDEKTIDQTVLSILQKKFPEGSKSLLDKMYQRGYEAGVRMFLIIDTLQNRFGSISDSLQEKIFSQDDLDALTPLGHFVAKCQSLEEFENRCDEYPLPTPESIVKKIANG